MKRHSFHSVGPSASARHPAGFSLIEVIMATAILLGSVIVLSQLAGLGRTHAQNADKLAQAQRICENTLNEIMLGIRPLSPVESAPLLPVESTELQDDVPGDVSGETLAPGRDEDRLIGSTETPYWMHTVRIEPEQGTPGLASLTVEVMEARRIGPRRNRFSLTRWIRQQSQSDSFDGFDLESDSPLGGFGE